MLFSSENARDTRLFSVIKQTLLDPDKNVTDIINLKCKPRGIFKDMCSISDNGRWHVKCLISF